MKKAILAITVFLGTWFVAQAQLEIKGGGGINFLSLSESPDAFNSEAQMGYQFGVALLIGEKFYGEPGVYWQRNASFLVDQDDPEEVEYQTNINSIRIPVHVGYHIIGGKEEKFVSLRIFLGPAANILTGVNSDYMDVSKDDYNTFLVDLDGGLGLDFWFIFVEAQYQFGLTKLYKDNGEGKLRGLAANAGFRIPF